MSASTLQHPVHALTIAPLQRAVRNTCSIMDKAVAHAAAHNTPIEHYLQARLYPNMFNLLQQLQYVSYLSVDFARHFTDQPPPRVGYDEATWQELRDSAESAATYLASISPANVTAAAGKTVPTFMDESKGMTAIDYGASVIVPDVFFHAVTAYALLRHCGVPLGKSDFFGDLDMKPL